MTCIRIKNGIICINNSYAAAIDDAKARLKRGERQHYCFVTRLWEWSTDCKCNPRIYTMEALERYSKRLAKEIERLKT